LSTNAASGTFNMDLFPAEIRAASGGGTPGGSNGQLQYNNSGAFGGAADFSYSGHTLAGGASASLDLSAQAMLTVRLPAPAGVAWEPWGHGYLNSATSGAPVNTQANGGISQMFFVQGAMAAGRINFRVGVASGAGSGLIFGIFDPTLANNYCTSTVATAGGSPDIGTTGVKSLTWASGPNVSSGICTLYGPANYVLVTSSDSTALRLVNHLDGGSSPAALLNANHAKYFGVTTGVTTGSGAALAFASLSGLTWLANSATLAAAFEL
jgi:hypothetical protein